MRAALKQRIITGLSLAVSLVLAILFAPATVLAVLLAVAVLIAAWEWSNLAGYTQGWARVAYAFALGLLMLAVYEHAGFKDQVGQEQVQAIVGAACVWWAIALLWVMGYPASAGLWNTRPMLGLIGIVVLVPAWLAVIFILSLPDGRFLLLFMFVVVAAADIGAYFAGKQFGRRKLALEVSPGKSWEGFWGGVVTCALVAIAGHEFVQPPQIGLAGALAIVLSSSLASVLGDLVESMVKRERGVKDSGTLLPGHGGMLDRIDGHTAAAPVFALGLILAAW